MQKNKIQTTEIKKYWSNYRTDTKLKTKRFLKDHTAWP